MKPLAIDLYCGLRLGLCQPEFRGRANAAIQEFMTGRTEHPDHVRLAVLHLAPHAVSSVFRFVGQFKDSRFAAGLTRARQFWVFAAHSRHDPGIFEHPSGVVNLLDTGIVTPERAVLLPRRFRRAFIRAVAAITVWINDWEMLSADATVSSAASDITLFSPSETTSTPLTFDRTVALIWALCNEPNTA